MKRISFLTIKKIFLLFSILTTLLVFFASTPISQEENIEETIPDKGITISPVKYEVNIKPGETFTGQVKYYNATGEDKTLYLKTFNFKPMGESGFPQFILDDTLPYNESMKDWVLLSSNEIFVEKMTPEYKIPTIIQFKVEVPANASPGGHYAGIVQSQVPFEESLNTENTGLALLPQSACLLIFNVEGKTTRQGTIEQFYVTDPFLADKKPISLFEYAPVQFIVRVRNYGNTHFKPQGNIFLYKGNSLIATFQVNEKEGNVLRESIRKFEEETWGTDNFFYREAELYENGSFITDKYGNIKTHLKFDFGKLSKLPIGKYKAKITLTYDDNGEKKIINGATSFWIIPWKIILIIFAIIIIVSIVIILQSKIRKTIRERKLKEKKPIAGVKFFRK